MKNSQILLTHGITGYRITGNFILLKRPIIVVSTCLDTISMSWSRAFQPKIHQHFFSSFSAVSQPYLSSFSAVSHQSLTSLTRTRLSPVSHQSLASLSPVSRQSLTSLSPFYPECWHFDNDVTRKIDDVLSEPFLLFEFFCVTPPLCLKVMG